MTKTSDLNDHERLVFVGLARFLINADHVVSLEELTLVRKIIDDIGREVWHATAQQANQRYRFVDDAVHDAMDIEREEAKRFIIVALRQLAECDGVVPAEADLVEQLEDIWPGIAPRPEPSPIPPMAPQEPDDDEPGYA